MELDGQVAIVTGAARGIGHAIAIELAGLGADVVAADLYAPTETAAEIRDGATVPWRCALTSPTPTTARGWSTRH